MEWTQREGDAYRRKYHGLTFQQKQKIMNTLVTEYNQNPRVPYTLLEFLAHHNRRFFSILELGGYDGSHAYTVLQKYPHYRWTNFDISPVVEKMTKSKLLEPYNYKLKILEEPICEYPLTGKYDVFYSSRTLEHLSLKEVIKTLEHTRNIPYHVHIVDFFHRDDTHVLELDAADELVTWYRSSKFNVTYGGYCVNEDYTQLRIYAGKTK